MRTLFGEDDSEDDGGANGGGGFLPPSREQDAVSERDDPAGETAGPNGVIEIGSDGSSGDDVEFTDGVSSASRRNKFDRAKFMELSNAEEEWAAWGGDADQDYVAASGPVEPKNARTDGSGGRGAILEVGPTSEEEDSDGGDDGVGQSFLMLGGGRSARTLSRADTPTSPKVPVDEVESQAQNVGENEDDDEDDGVDWEDGDSAAESVGPSANSVTASNLIDLSEPVRETEEMYSDGEGKVTAGRGDVVEVESSDGEGACSLAAAAASIDGETSTAHGIDGPEKGESAGVLRSASAFPGGNDFAAPRTEAASAALERAQGTASRLADWAGRAFKRAIAEHDGGRRDEDAESEGGAEGRRHREEIDLTADGDKDDEVIELDDAEEEKAPGEKSPNEDGPARDGGGEMAPSRTVPPPPMPALFDTSIDGLDRAEREILDEEREMERDMSTITDEMKDDILRLLRVSFCAP